MACCIGILQQLLTADYRIRSHDLERSCHCLHPAFLSASLYASLHNLSLQTVSHDPDGKHILSCVSLGLANLLSSTNVQADIVQWPAHCLWTVIANVWLMPFKQSSSPYLPGFCLVSF